MRFEFKINIYDTMNTQKRFTTNQVFPFNFQAHLKLFQRLMCCYQYYHTHVPVPAFTCFSLPLSLQYIIFQVFSATCTFGDISSWLFFSLHFFWFIEIHLNFKKETAKKLKHDFILLVII